METLKSSKDTTFGMIREAKAKINKVVDALSEHDAYILKNRQNISIMNQNMTEIKQEIEASFHSYKNMLSRLMPPIPSTATNLGYYNQISTSILYHKYTRIISLKDLLQYFLK